MGRNYVGVSGVATAAQQELVAGVASEVGFDFTNYQLLLGVKATEKTQLFDVPNKYGELWYPVGEDFREAIKIVWDYDRVETLNTNLLPCIQLYLGETTNNASLTRDFILRLLDRSAGWTTSRPVSPHQSYTKPVVQLDQFPWMSSDQDEFFIWLQDQVNNVIIQCHKDYMEHFHPYEIVRRLSAIQGLEVIGLTVLFDASHGTGREMDPESLRPFIGAVKESKLEGYISIGVAGGLPSDGVEKYLGPLMEEFGLLSWDAESRLHYGNRKLQGDFDTEVLRRYLKSSAELIWQFALDEY